MKHAPSVRSAFASWGMRLVALPQASAFQLGIPLPPGPRPRPLLTWFCVATKKNGLEGWNATRTTRPRFLRKGFWLARRDSWCTTTACEGGKGEGTEFACEVFLISAGSSCSSGSGHFQPSSTWRNPRHE